MSANGRAQDFRATSERGSDGDDEVRDMTYEEPFLSLSCITRRVSQSFRRERAMLRSGRDQTHHASQFGITRMTKTTCAGNGRLTLMTASLIMSAVKTR